MRVVCENVIHFHNANAIFKFEMPIKVLVGAQMIRPSASQEERVHGARVEALPACGAHGLRAHGGPDAGVAEHVAARGGRQLHAGFPG